MPSPPNNCQVKVTKHNIKKYQKPSPPNIVRLSDDKQVIFVEWPKLHFLQYWCGFIFMICYAECKLR
jgi:hypothetical protein